MEGKVYHINDTKELNKISGIYKIKFEGSDNFYIGSSHNIGRRRLSHRSNLRISKHYNAYLSNVYNKYGEDKCFVEIMALCDKAELIEKEQFFIDTLKPKYNMAKSAAGGSTIGLTDEQILNIRFEFFSRQNAEDLQDIADKYNIVPTYVKSIAHGHHATHVKNTPELDALIEKNKFRRLFYRDGKRKRKTSPKDAFRKLTEEQVGMIRWAMANDRSIADLGEKLGIDIGLNTASVGIREGRTYANYPYLVDASHLNLLPAPKKHLSDDDVSKIRWAYGEGYLLKEIARVMGCCKHTVSNIRRNYSYTHTTDITPVPELFKDCRKERAKRILKTK